jgi:hypothetical protein
MHVLHSWRGLKEVLEPLKLFIIDGLLGLQDAADIAGFGDGSDVVVVGTK